MLNRISSIIGWTLIFLGLCGFVTTPILGVFATNALHNVIHLLLGICLIYMSMRYESQLFEYSFLVGVILVTLSLVGNVASTDSGEILGYILSNHASNGLHLVLGSILIASALLSKRQSSLQ